MTRASNNRALLGSLREELAAGEASSADPANANLPQLERRITTLYSPWFGRFCRVCGFKFREGDRVRQCSECGEPYHDDPRYGLYCWQKQFVLGAICNPGGDDRFSEDTDPLPSCRFPQGLDVKAQAALAKTLVMEPQTEQESSDGLAAHFIAGVETLWRPFGGRRSIKVLQGSPYVGLSCPWCRFMVRVGDWVVPCPCEGDCGTVFHQDVFRHLTCWNEWNGPQGRHHCPNTGSPYRKDE